MGSTVCASGRRVADVLFHPLDFFLFGRLFVSTDTEISLTRCYTLGYPQRLVKPSSALLLVKQTGEHVGGTGRDDDRLPRPGASGR